MGIGKAQAEAIADGFLDSLGANPDDFAPRKTFTEIILIAGELILSAQNNLNTSGSNASGKLSASLIAGEPTLEGKVFKVDVLMNFYGLFVNKGVKGTKSGSSTAGYSFKHDSPSKDMVKAIKEWIDNGHAITRTVKKYKSHGKHETKHRKLAKLSEADASYATARAIKQHGIKPTGFFDKAVATTQDKIAARLGAALKIDLQDSMENLS